MTGTDPYGAALVGAAAVSTGSPPASFSYTDGVAWTDALTVALTTTGACTLWAHGWLALSANVQSAAAVGRRGSRWTARGRAAPWVRAARSSGCNSCAPTPRASRCLPPARGRVRLQARVKIAGATVTCTGGLLHAEARATGA
ncbi:MAG: hypothetical protein WKH64_17535 [Chloroflexia bacterium]